jgi:hypothetical protein
MDNYNSKIPLSKTFTSKSVNYQLIIKKDTHNMTQEIKQPSAIANFKIDDHQKMEEINEDISQ